MCAASPACGKLPRHQVRRAPDITPVGFKACAMQTQYKSYMIVGLKTPPLQGRDGRKDTGYE